jgi:hypothetical protein
MAEPHLGLATNAELLRELTSRVSMGHTDPDYRTSDAGLTATESVAQLFATLMAENDRSAQRVREARESLGVRADEGNLPTVPEDRYPETEADIRKRLDAAFNSYRGASQLPRPSSLVLSAEERAALVEDDTVADR